MQPKQNIFLGNEKQKNKKNRFRSSHCTHTHTKCTPQIGSALPRCLVFLCRLNNEHSSDQGPFPIKFSLQMRLHIFDLCFQKSECFIISHTTTSSTYISFILVVMRQQHGATPQLRIKRHLYKVASILFRGGNNLRFIHPEK